jgi:epoxyqueuosine reductase QueG
MKQMILDALVRFIAMHDDFRIGSDIAIDEDSIGLPLFDTPVIGVCDANDPWFEAFKKEGVIGLHHKLPSDWLDGATRVISVFLPFTDEVVASNRGGGWPSAKWLHARYEGQQAIGNMAAYLRSMLQDQGFMAVAPMLDERFATGVPGNSYTSNWSERHTAFACNLGTFSLSRGLITDAKGVCGRFFSVVTDAPVPVDARQTRETEANCSHCGSCITACPPKAIDFEHGKDHPKCDVFLKTIKQKETPRYGCGKCQAGMPCERTAPACATN